MEENKEELRDEDINAEALEERRKLFAKYKYIVAWSKMMGSFEYYIEQQCEQAEKDNAPVDVVYKKRIDDDKEEWIRYDDLGVHAKERLAGWM